MRKLAVSSAVALAVALGMPAGVRADNSSPSLPNGTVGMTFRFTTAVSTPKGTQSASGTIAISRTGPEKLLLTVTTNGGSTRTIPLVVANGAIKPDPAATAAPGGNPETQAAAKALLSNMKLAAGVGVAARKSSGKSFTVPVTLTPVGQGTAIPADLAMTVYQTSHGTAYVGEVEQSTTTRLPASGGIDPAQLEKSVGVAVGGTALGLTPAGRAAAMVAMHHRNEEQKKAAGGELPDAIALTVNSHFANDRFRDISGRQTDTLKIGNKTVAIVSSWSFTAISSRR
jgi:hypothetical protein